MIVMEQQEEKILGMQRLGNLSMPPNSMPSNIRSSSNNQIPVDPNDFLMEFEQRDAVLEEEKDDESNKKQK